MGQPWTCADFSADFGRPGFSGQSRNPGGRFGIGTRKVLVHYHIAPLLMSVVIDNNPLLSLSSWAAFIAPLLVLRPGRQLATMAPALLTAVDATSHIHLIVGSNPLAGARCSRSIEVGAKPILIAPEDSTLHYGLVKRIEAGEVKWIKRSFQDEDLTTWGRPEVDGVVDAVFVTAGGKQTSG